MTDAPCRHLRTQADDSPDRPPLTQRDRDRRAYILDAAERMFLRHGRAAVTLKEFSYAVGIPQFTIRKHISCLDHAFAITLTKYLDRILAAITAVKYTEPDMLARRRAEYFRISRGFCDIPTPMHFLLLRDRFTLPPDELAQIDRQHRMIGHMLGGANAEEILAQLDCPTMGLGKIESICALIESIDRDRREHPKPPPSFTAQPEPAPEPPEPDPNPQPAIADPTPPDPIAGLSDDMLDALADSPPPEPQTGPRKDPPPSQQASLATLLLRYQPPPPNAENAS